MSEEVEAQYQNLLKKLPTYDEKYACQSASKVLFLLVGVICCCCFDFLVNGNLFSLKIYFVQN
jgi:hypothetical protein